MSFFGSLPIHWPLLLVTAKILPALASGNDEYWWREMDRGSWCNAVTQSGSNVFVIEMSTVTHVPYWEQSFWLAEIRLLRRSPQRELCLTWSWLTILFLHVDSFGVTLQHLHLGDSEGKTSDWGLPWLYPIPSPPLRTAPEQLAVPAYKFHSAA